MTHNYELRVFNDDGSTKTVLKLAAEPKYAKEKAKDYANQHPGLYTLQKIEMVEAYCTEERVDKND